ncbi:MAG: Ig-like domain-containing protein, partial [Deinococcota bacterium]
MVTKSTQVSTVRAGASTLPTRKAHLWRILLVGLLAFLISACGGDDPPGEGQGSIGISVVGLPAGTNAAIVVTGSNFSRTVTANDAFPVDAGSYAINASNVSASGYNFTANAIPDSVSVIVDEVAGVLVRYNAVPRVVASGIPVINVREGERETLDLNTVIEDFENGRLNFEVITNSNPNVVATSVTSGVLAVRALQDAIDIEATVTAILTIRVTDDAGNTIEEAVRVNAIYTNGDGGTGNRPPSVTGELPDIRVGVGAAPISYDLTNFFADPDGFNTLDFSIISTTVSVASASVSGNTLTVTFANPGITNIRVTATDDEGATTSQGFQVSVVGITIPAVEGEQGGSTTIDLDDVFGNLGDNLSYEATSSNTDVATVSIDDNGVLTIDFVGPGTSVITVTVRDPEGDIVSQVSFTVTVTDGNNNGGGDNTAPVTRGLPDIIAEQNEPSRTFNLASFFSDAEDGGSGLSYEASSSDGAVSGVSLDGTRLTVSFGAVGNASITVVATDSGDLSVTDVFRVTVLPPFSNTAPTANDDTATAIAGITTSINVLVNDSDPESQALTVASVTQPSTGTASNQSNRVEYTAPGTFTGQVTFDYTIRDTFGATDSATVTVDVVANTGVPVANNDTAATLENTPLNVAAAALLANDTDPDTGDTLTVTAVDGSGG